MYRGRGKLSTFCLATIAILSVTLIITIGVNQSPLLPRHVTGQVIRIPEGPMGVSNAVAGDPYWFQQGAVGDSSTHNSVGSRVTIRTVYDALRNDAHSYWVGSILANGAFVQVGYLNGLTTTNQFYCCAWFYEFFPAGNTNSPPIIGPAGSAGPIGSSHTYSMNYTGNYIWSFYMDNQYLGSSPASGQQYYLGPGDTNTGSHAVAALSEVAQTNDNMDVIGPAEFKNFQYETSSNAWTNVPTGLVHWGYGVTSSTNLQNPYSVTEVQGIQNDFLTGSNIPYPGNDQCGNSAPYNQNPALDSKLWPVTCLGGTTISLSFVDENGTGITPTWISLTDSSSGRELFYTDYQDYRGLSLPTGQWIVSQVPWHAINVTNGQTVNASLPSQIFSTQVFSVKLAVVGSIYSLPVRSATVIMYLPDSTNQTISTDGNGEGGFTQIPPSNYAIHISVPYGLASNQVESITGPGSIVAKVFSLPELITIIVPPIFIAVLASAIVVKKERERQALIQAQAPAQPPFAVSYCRSCGKPLSPTANFCTSCGTPVRMAVT